MKKIKLVNISVHMTDHCAEEKRVKIGLLEITSCLMFFDD
jgi:hypothetical protein